MKKYLVSGLVLIALGFASQTDAAIILKNQCQVSVLGTFQTALGCSLGTVTTGDTVIVVTQPYTPSGNTTSTISDSQGNTYSIATNYAWQASTTRGEILYAPNVTGGPSFNVTSTFATSSEYTTVFAFDYAGLLAAYSLDATSSNTYATVGGAVNSGSANTSQAGELLIGEANTGGGGSITAGTSMLTIGTSTNNAGLVEATTTGGTGSYAANFTIGGGSFSTGASMATFKAATTAASTPSYKQTVHGTGALSMTATLTGVTAGDLLVIAWSETNNTKATTTDAEGTPLFAASTTNWHGSNGDSLWYEPNAASGTHAITITFSSSTQFENLNVFEYGNMATSSVVDKIATSTNSGSSGPVLSGNMVSAAPNDLAIGFGDSAGDSLTAATGYTLRGVNTFEDNATSSLASGSTVSTTFPGFAGSAWSDIGVLFFAASTTTTTTATPDALFFAGD